MGEILCSPRLMLAEALMQENQIPLRPRRSMLTKSYREYRHHLHRMVHQRFELLELAQRILGSEAGADDAFQSCLPSVIIAHGPELPKYSTDGSCTRHPCARSG